MRSSVSPCVLPQGALMNLGNRLLIDGPAFTHFFLLKVLSPPYCLQVLVKVQITGVLRWAVRIRDRHPATVEWRYLLQLIPNAEQHQVDALRSIAFP